MSHRPALLLTLSLALTACAATPPAAPPPLTGNWALQQTSDLPAPPASIRLVLSASPEHGGEKYLEVSGFSGINHYRGQASVYTPENMLIIYPVATTDLPGNEGRTKFETPYLQHLEQVARYEWKGGNTLVLRTLAGESLTFARVDPLK